MNAFGKHTMRSSIQPSKTFEHKIRCVTKKKRKKNKTMNNRLDSEHHYTYITIAVITTRPDLPFNPCSTETVVL